MCGCQPEQKAYRGIAAIFSETGHPAEIPARSARYFRKKPRYWDLLKVKAPHSFGRGLWFYYKLKSV